MAEPSDDIVNIDEAARILDISKPTLYRLLAQGALRGLKVGKRWRFRKAELDSYMSRGPAAQISTPLADLEQELDFMRTAVDEAGGYDSSAAPYQGDDPAERVITFLANFVVILSVLKQASDIHLEPINDEQRHLMRFRIRLDGVLHEIRRFPDGIREPLIAHYKQLANMSPSERQTPQHGRMPMKFKGTEYQLFVRTVPGILGEELVMRIVRADSFLCSLDAMDIETDDLTRIREMLTSPNGLILCAGPKGSGKTSVLYSCLASLVSSKIKAVSIEDPVDIAIPGVTQMQVNNKLGLTYASGIEALMTQDPNIIMVGEMRDKDVADASLGAALTGYLVMSAINAKDATDAIVRLSDLDVEPYLISETLTGVIAIRLCRRLCEACRVEFPAWTRYALRDHLVELAAEGGYRIKPNAVFYKAVGCEKCHQRGYRGRVAIYEVLKMTDAIANGIVSGATAQELRRDAVDGGMKSLVADGVRKAEEGKTTLDELLRVVADTL